MKWLPKIFLPFIVITLLFGFWLNADFKTIAAGVSIFLFGMYFLKNGFKVFTGGALEKLLAKGTNKLWKSIILGMSTTAVMQSSALVSVILVSFVSAGVISLAAGIGVIFGANIGTTAGAWLVASFGLKVKISAYAMPMLVIGLVFTFQKSKELRGLGFIIAGLGFLFLGIHFMREGFEAFKDQIDLTQYALGGLKGLLIYALIGAMITVVMQSSNATMVLIITALSLQHINYENAVALAIGANIGTTLTAIISSLNSNNRGRQLASAHFLFNVSTGFLAILGIEYITQLVETISGLIGIDPTNFTLRLAVFHTTFNVIGVLLISPFISLLVRFLEKSIKPIPKKISEPLYLNEASLEYPETLLMSLHNELLHVYRNVSKLFTKALHVDRAILQSDNLKKDIKMSQQTVDLDFNERYQFSIKTLIAAIIEFSGKAQGVITEQQQEQLFALRLAAVKLLESTKSIDGLRHNMKKHIHSENKAVRNEYNKMRLLILSVLKELNQLDAEKDYDLSALLSLEDIRVEIKKYRKETNARLDKLIREGKIDSVTATSILNDRTFARDAAKRLLDTGMILFSTQDLELKKAEKIISLSEQDIEDIASSEAP